MRLGLDRIGQIFSAWSYLTLFFGTSQNAIPNAWVVNCFICPDRPADCNGNNKNESGSDLESGAGLIMSYGSGTSLVVKILRSDT